MPLTHNDGQPISPEKFSLTRDELIAQFGAVSLSPQSVFGVWMHEGVRYEDESRRLTVDVEDTPEHQQFFAEWKATLLQRFEQIEIYIISYPIERI